MYWKKLNSSSRWEVVALDGVRAHITEIVQTTQIVGRAQTGEFNKIMDHVRLVEIALLEGQSPPVNCRKLVNPVHYEVKSMNTGEQFWFDSHLEIEHIDESALAQSDFFRQRPDQNARTAATNMVQRCQNCRMTFWSADQTRRERTLKGLKSSFGRRFGRHSVANLNRNTTPNIPKINVCILQFVGRKSKEWECTSRFEVHAHDRCSF